MQELERWTHTIQTSEKEVYASSQNGMHNGSAMSGIGCSAELLLK